VIPNLPWTSGHYQQIGAELTRLRTPAIAIARPFAEAGGLISYGPSEATESSRRSSIACCAARTRATFRSSNHGISTLSSTCGPPRLSGSRSRSRCCFAPPK